MKRMLLIFLAVLAVAGLITGGAFYYHHKSLFPSTNDAYVQAHVINIAPQINGVVSEVDIKENQHVKKGQILFKLKTAPYLIAVNKAKAESDQVHSQSQRTQTNSSHLKEVESSLAQAKLNLSYTVVKSPTDGYVENFDLRQGAVVSAYSPVFVLIEDKSWWIKANFKETDMQRILPGQPVQIKLDMYPGHYFQGKIASLANSSSSSFSLLPSENASANWVKVTQRFPIRILITDPSDKQYPLRLGASAAVSINTTQ